MRCVVSAPLLALCVLATACQRQNPATGPTAITGLTIEGRDDLLTGQSFGYRAVASGTAAFASAVWTSSDPSVASIDSQGVVTAHKHGSTRLEASIGRVTTSKAVGIVSNFSGRWLGQAAVRQCDDGGHFDDPMWPACLELPQGGILTVMFELSHAADLRVVSGLYSLDSVVASFLGHCEVKVYPAIPLSGRVSDHGHLAIAGTIPNAEGRERWTLSRWDTSLTPAGEIRGEWVQDLDLPGTTLSLELELRESSKIPHPCHFGFSF